MSESLVIDLDSVDVWFAQIIAALRQRSRCRVEVAVDYYWDLAPDDAFDISREPTAPRIGSLSDDLLEAGAIEDPAEAGHALAHLTGVLRALEACAGPYGHVLVTR